MDCLEKGERDRTTYSEETMADVTFVYWLIKNIQISILHVVVVMFAQTCLDYKHYSVDSRVGSGGRHLRGEYRGH